ncbi:MAG TPA: type II toxin-antitoxin system VapC family toxin [Pyrinomonadaceae bacterium]|nr:type II toxin-antitoxin system VapC family toxin [Pyrinomonadaceae bacterium]
MGKLESLISGRVVAFDTAPLIYYIEENLTYLPLVEELFELIDSGSAQGVTSVLTLLEVLVKPMREGRKDVADDYRQILTGSANIYLHPIGESVCEGAAVLRSKYPWLRTPDAIQIATALSVQADVVVTNDERWKRIVEIEVIVLDEI